MILLLCLLLFICTILIGALPLKLKIAQEWNQYILAFSGSVLLGITFLHLIPETVEDLGHRSGFYILGGFFLQLFLQKFSHGIEHGHIHHHENQLATSIFIGLSIHAFLEGIPLGYNYAHEDTTSSIFLAITAHKLPEAITLMSFLAPINIPQRKKWIYLFLFALMTPLAGCLSYYFGSEYAFTSSIVKYLVPLVMGAFIHISTTIFFESGTSHHQLTIKKIIAAFIGIVVALSTMIGH
jgi:zinc transporter ZupT